MQAMKVGLLPNFCARGIQKKFWKETVSYHCTDK